MAVEVINLMDLIENEKKEKQQSLCVEKVCRFTTTDRMYDYIVRVEAPERLTFCKIGHGKMNHQEMNNFVEQHLDSFVKGSKEKAFYDYVIQFNSDQDMATIGLFPTDEALGVTQSRKSGLLAKTKRKFERFRKR